MSSIVPTVDSGQSTAQELVFIDANVDNWELLLGDLTSDNADRNLSFLRLDANRDGVEQISKVLPQRYDVTAIHLISHGNDTGSVPINVVHFSQSRCCMLAVDICEPRR